jgi:hypothetical protein
MAQLPTQSALICAVAKGQLCLCGRASAAQQQAPIGARSAWRGSLPMSSVGRGRPSTAVWRSLCHGQSVRQRPRRSVGARSRCCRPAFQIRQSRLGGSVGLASGSRKDRPNPRGRPSTRTTETKLRPRHRAQLQLSISRSSRYREVYGTSSGRSARRRSGG